MREIIQETPLTGEDLKKLQHMLGVSDARKKRDWGYRNSYCCEVGGADEQQLLSLQERGFVERGRTFNEGRDVYFHATEAGCRAAGLKGKQIARAMGD